MPKVTGAGTIVQLEKDKPRGKCRKWQLRVSTGRDLRTGRYRTRTKRVTGTYTDAKRALRDFIAGIESDKEHISSDCTLESYCEHFLAHRAATKAVAETTQDRNRYRLHAACRHLGKMRLGDIQPSMLDDMYAAMMGGDTLSGKPSSGTYVGEIHTTLNLLFRMAMKERLVASNPCDDAAPPPKDTGPRRAMDEAAVRRFVAALDPADPHQCAFLLAVTMGLRRGEICGLSWGDVDLEGGRVIVAHSYNEKGHLKEPKTRAGLRFLPLSDFNRQMLSEAKTAQKEEFARRNAYRKRCGKPALEQTPATPVVVTEYGTRPHPATIDSWWRDDREDLGAGGYHLHEMRHTYLTLLASKGVSPKVMQELAGHATVAVTLQIYTHVNLEQKQKAVDALAEMF